MTRHDAILLIRYATCVMTGLNEGLARLMDTALDNIIASLRDCPENCAECGTDDDANIIRHISTKGQ